MLCLYDLPTSFCANNELIQLLSVFFSLSAEDCDDFGDHSTPTSDSPGSSHMSSHNGELLILSVHSKGEGPLALDGHDTLFTASKLETLNSLSADHSVAKSLEHVERLVYREELTGHQGGGKGRPGVLSGEGFPDNTNMTIHMGTHTGEKLYGCDQCMKRFQHKDYLKLHMRSHSAEKPYRCDQCTKSFKSKDNLKLHMRIHSREKLYRCDQCMKSFNCSSHLKDHMRSHSGEKPYRWDQCMKGFRRCSYLKVHMRIHSGEQHYRCDQCTKHFKWRSGLKNHMRTHSGESPGGVTNT